MSDFEAKYPGTCCTCEDRIHVGDLVTYALDDVLVHTDCEGSARPVRKQDVCTVCWLVKPCDCEDRK